MNKVQITKATERDVFSLIQIQNESFYGEYKKHGVCPGYDYNEKMMHEVLKKTDVYLIQADGRAVGDCIVIHQGQGSYFLASFCVIPSHEGKGIGQQAIQIIENIYGDAKRWFLQAPADNEKNIYFCEKQGYHLKEEYFIETMRVALFEKWVKRG